MVADIKDRLYRTAINLFSNTLLLGTSMEYIGDISKIFFCKKFFLQAGMLSRSQTESQITLPG